MKKNLSVISDQPPGKTDKIVSIAALQIRQLLFARSFKVLATLALLVVSVLTNFANAQTPPYFKTGTGTSGNTIPLNQASQKTQLLYAPGDFSTTPISGNITKIYFRNSTAGAFATYTDFKVSFIQNSLASFPSSSYLTGLTLAHSVTTQSVTANATAGGWFEIPLNAPYFQYDNTQTLVIEIQYTAKTDGISTTTSTSIGNKRISGTSLTATTGTVNTIWNDFGMTVIPSTPCAGLPNAGTAISSATVVCPNVNFQLSLTGNTSASGLTYQWQSSPNGTTWTDITGATNPFLTTSQTATTQYRAQVTCSGQTASSASVTVNTNSAPVSGTFTINKILPASGTNFQSFAAAITSLQCGGISGPVTFNVVSGTGPYTEDVVITAISGASATNTVTINGNGNTLRGISSAGNPVMKLDGADYIRVNDLNIEAEASATAGQVIHLTNGADNNVFTGNTFKHNTTSTATSYVIYIYTGSNNNNTFTNNNIIGAYYGVYNYGTSATVAQNNNRFLNNNFKDQYYYGFYNYYGTNTTLEGNDISRMTRTNGTTMYMIYMSTGSTGFTISKNRLHNTHDAATATTGTVYGIYSSAAGTGVGSENMVTNNAIYNINNTGGTLYAIYNTGGNNTLYYYNTISADMAAVNYTTLRGMYFLSASTNVKFINNNISLSSTATTKHALYLGSTTIALQSNNNNLYAPSGNVGYYSANQATLANWKAANSGAYDQASVSADPQYVNLSTGILRPTNSTLNNIGVAVTGITDDISGATRNATTPDPGAYEFTPAANDAGITAVISPTSPVQPGVSQPVQVTIKNYGSSALTSATITWTVNGIAQPAFNWTGNLANNATANATIGNFTFIAGTHTVNACTSLPNGIVDANPGNDCTQQSVISCAAFTGTYTINKNLPTSGTNFQSFGAAINAMSGCGLAGAVTFDVVSGTGPYLEHVTIPVIPGVSATNTLTFNGNGNTLRGTASTGTPVMKLDGADYIRVNNLVMEAEGTATAGQVIHLTNGADNNVFTGNTFKHSITSTATSYVIYIYTGSNNNNTFTGNNIIGAYYGVYNYGTSATAAQNNNRFLNNIFKDQYYYGFYNYYGTNTTLEGNDISRPTRTNSGTMYMVYMSTGSTGSNISKNRLHNTHDAATATTGTVYGIYSSAAGTGVGSENLVQNNAIYNINNNGGTLYAIYNTGGNNTHYYYNTISADLQNVSYTTLRGMYFLSASTNVKFINNNISLSSNATTAKHALYLGSATITLQSNNNNLYAPGGNVGYYSANRITLADWKAANSAAYDQASVSADPIYSGLLAGNLKPTSVALNDKGQVVSSVTTDINGLTRSTTTPDPGAYEFSINPNDVGVTAITGVSSGCGLTSTQLVTITVKNFGSAPQSNIPVNFMVGGAIIGTGIVPGPVAPNGTATFTFTATANLGAPGPYTIIAKTLMTGDADASNDSFTLNVTNSLIPTLPIALNFETPATGIGAVQVVTNSKSTIVEAAGASNGAGSTKGMIMAGVTASNWVLPVGVIDPWTNNGDQFSAIKMCINPTSGPAKDSLFLLFDLKQLFKVANANTNLRVTVNGQQVGPTYRPPFSGTPIVWQRIRVDLTPYKHLPNVEIALESSVKEEYAGGAGTANLIDNMILSRRTTGLKSDILQSLTAVYPNPSTGIFNVTAPNGNFTMEVTDMTGKTILKQNANGATSQLNLQKAAKGIYLLKITSEGSIATQRLVIQ